MNLLIVDDEYYSVEGLYASMNWSKLGIKDVYKAYSMKQAQEIFNLHKINILVSDIEMPKGSGLDLLRWVREKGYDTATIFLTSHANFDYASNAIKLQSTNYLLKPVDNEELKACLIAAIQKVKKTEMYALYETNAKYWNSNKKRLEEDFWYNLCNLVIPEDSDQIARELKQYHLPKSLLKDNFYLGLLEAYIKPLDDPWEKNLYEYAVRNIVNEVLNINQIDFVFTRYNEEKYFLCINQKYINEKTKFKEICHQILNGLITSLPGVFQIFLNKETTLLNLGSNFQKLINVSKRVIHEDCKVIDITSMPNKSITSKLPSMDQWYNMLIQGRKLEVKEEAFRYLSGLRNTYTAERSDLVRFYHDFIQIIYSILEKNGESAHRLFSNKTSEKIFEKALNSIDDMKTWVTHVIELLDECLVTIKQSSSSVEIVKKYIRDHINEDLTRNKLASIVYFSPDYLSHVFREKTGESLSNFILSERIKKSKELLLISEFTIRDIALQTGFSNVSYFSRQFKNLTKMTPTEFRKNKNTSTKGF